MLTNNLSFRNKSLRARIKIVHIDMRMQDIEKIFCSPEKKKSKAKEQFSNSIPDALRDLHTSNAIDLTMSLPTETGRTQ